MSLQNIYLIFCVKYIINSQCRLRKWHVLIFGVRRIYPFNLHPKISDYLLGQFQVTHEVIKIALCQQIGEEEILCFKINITWVFILFFVLLVGIYVTKTQCYIYQKLCNWKFVTAGLIAEGKLGYCTECLDLDVIPVVFLGHK